MQTEKAYIKLIVKLTGKIWLAQLAGAVEYTNRFSADG